MKTSCKKSRVNFQDFYLQAWMHNVLHRLKSIFFPQKRNILQSLFISCDHTIEHSSTVVQMVVDLMMEFQQEMEEMANAQFRVMDLNHFIVV